MTGHRTIGVLCLAATCVAVVPAAAQVVMPQSSSRATVDPKTREQALEHHRRGWRALAAEDWDSAREQFTSAIRVIAVFPMAYYGLGKAHMGLKTFDNAITAFSTCRDQYKMMAGAEFGSQLEVKQRRQDQMLELRSVLRELQSAPSAQTRAAQGLAQSRQIRDLQTYLRQLEDADKSGYSTSPDLAVPAEVFLSLGSAHFRANHLSEAEAQYLNALKAKPDFGEALNNLAVIALMDGRAGEAEEYAKKAEKAGYRVNPQLKDDIKAAKGSQ